MHSASGNNDAIVDVHREGLKTPCFCKSEKGENVDCRQDGGERGPLGSAMVEDDFGEGFTIEGQCDLLICEKRVDPVAQGWSKAKEVEDVDQAIDM